MTIIEQIKAEIDKLYGEYKDKFHQYGDQYHLGLIDGLDMAERVLDTLESEKLVPNDLAEAAEEYVKKGKYLPEGWVVRPAFKAGAKWQKELMMKEAVEYEVWDFSSSLEAHPHVNIPLDNKQYRSGDKVRVIVLPKED